VLETTEEDLQHKLQGMEEDVIYLKSDIEALTASNDEHRKASDEELEAMRKHIMETEAEKKALMEEIAGITATYMAQPETPTKATDIDPKQKEEHDKVQMLLFKQNKDIDFIKATLNHIAEENWEHDHKKDASSPTALKSAERAYAQLEDMKKKMSELERERDELRQAALLRNADDGQAADLEDDLRYQLSKQDSEIELLNLKLREAELHNKTLDTKLRTAKVENRGAYIGNQTVSSTNVSSKSTVVIDTVTTISKQVTTLVSSPGIDPEILKKELLRLAQQYDSLRNCNTRLLNKLQAVQGGIQVCCRTRPPSYPELAQGGNICIDSADDHELMCYDSRSELWRSFFFDRVWRADANQAEVFEDVEPLVVSVLDGYNACIMAYGQTGSGKTFTMDGYGDHYGVNFHTVQTLFDMLILRQVQAEAHETYAEQLRQGHAEAFSNENSSNRRNSSGIAVDSAAAAPAWRDHDASDDEGAPVQPFSFSLTLSMMEIYNEQVFDLLNSRGQGGGQSADGVSLDIRQNAENATSVPGLQQMRVKSMQDVMNVFSRGTANRATASTGLNERSSRSHLIVQVDVTTQRGSDMPVKSRLSLVDLAGSERLSKSGATGATMKEAQYINKSLSALGDVMEALDQKSKFVPYRNSKLTYLLQNSLGGNSRTMMVVTVCPTDLTFEESLFTLQFATRVRNINVGAAQKQSNAKNLESSLKTLRNELKDAKKAKLASDEALLDLKKEQRKAPPTAVMEAKLKSIEEARKAGEILMQQLNRQITECNVKLTDEKGEKEKLSNELTSTQRNLKKALEQLRDQTKENERLEQLLQEREGQLDIMQQMSQPIGEDDNFTQEQQQNGKTKDGSFRRPPAPNSSPLSSQSGQLNGSGSGSRSNRGAPAASSAPPSSSRLQQPRQHYSSPSNSSNGVLKEFMLPTASSVAHVTTGALEQAERAEQAANATHGNSPKPPLPVPPAPGSGGGGNGSVGIRSLSPQQGRGGGGGGGGGSTAGGSNMSVNTSVSGSDFGGGGSSVGNNNHNRGPSSSWQDLMAPTAAYQARIRAADEEAALKAQAAANATHAGTERMAISNSTPSSRSGTPSRRDGHSFVGDDGGGGGDGTGSVRSGMNSSNNNSPQRYVNPKGHSSWVDATKPTMSRRNSIAAAEAEQLSKMERPETHPPSLGRLSISPSIGGRGRAAGQQDAPPPPRPGSSDYVNPKGHSSWEDATVPTKSRRLSLAAQEEENAKRAEEAARATHAINRGRFSLSATASNRWDQYDDPNSPTSKQQQRVDYVNPKGHSSWEDATAPTASRQAAIAAAEADYLESLERQSTNLSASYKKPFYPSSKAPERPNTYPPHDVSSSLYDEPGDSGTPSSSSSYRPPYGSSNSSSFMNETTSSSRRSSFAGNTPPLNNNSNNSSSGDKRRSSSNGSYSSAGRNGSNKNSGYANTTTPPNGGSAGTNKVQQRSPAPMSSSSSSSASPSTAPRPQQQQSLLSSSSMVKRSSTAVNATTVSTPDSRYSSLSVRSEEAMKRHQLRMDKRREITGGSYTGTNF